MASLLACTSASMRISQFSSLPVRSPSPGHTWTLMGGASLSMVGFVVLTSLIVLLHCNPCTCTFVSFPSWPYGNLHLCDTVCPPHMRCLQQWLQPCILLMPLAFYLHHTFQASPRLFLAIAECYQGCTPSSQCFFKWISHCIKECYALSHVPPPLRVTALSTQAHATTTAFLADIPWQDICRMATWSSIHTFTTLYAITLAAAIGPIV